DGARRLPSSRTSVRLAPRLRRFSALPARLAVAVLDVRLEFEPRNTGSLFRPSGILLGVVVCSCSVDTTVSGVGALVLSRLTSEPVTTTSSDWLADCASAKSGIASALAAQSRVIFERLRISPLPEPASPLRRVVDLTHRVRPFFTTQNVAQFCQTPAHW